MLKDAYLSTLLSINTFLITTLIHLVFSVFVTIISSRSSSGKWE